MADDPQFFYRVRDQFDELFELPTTERGARLAELHTQDPELAREVERLLSWNHDAQGFLEATRTLGARATATSGAPSAPEMTFYRLTDLLGRGGMGSVYRAERTDGLYKKPVAVKILDRSADTPEIAARFRAERQILAALEHPHIAKLLDGGTTRDGRPFYVMELIEGEPIDRYCNEVRLGLRDRISLFLKVCSAVGFAHRHLVVHRDIKPGNILVGKDGEPRLLDFGIAKLLEGETLDLTRLPTEHGIAPLTPEYASPEQVSGGAVSVGSDVYALGVLLYRLLTGCRPYQLAGLRFDQIVAVISTVEPTKPSLAAREEGEDCPSAAERAAARGTDPKGLARQLAGDLDTLLGKALRKEPERRYASVERLAADLEAYLEGRPIEARPDTFGYRAGKFLLRHRWAASAVAVALTALLTLLVLLWQQRLDLLERQAQLVSERNVSKSVSGFLTRVFAMPNPTEARGREVTAIELLDRGTAEIDRELADQPEAKAALLLTMGQSYKNLGRYREAEKLFAQALALERKRGAQTGATAVGVAGVAVSLHELAEVASLEGRYAQAERFERAALAERRKVGLAEDEAYVEGLSRLGRILDRAGRLDEGARIYERALSLGRRLDRPVVVATTLQRYASLERHRDRREKAEAMLREALAIQSRHLGEDHPAVSLTANDLGLVVLERGRAAEAETLLLGAEQWQRKIYPQGHPDLAATLHNRALVARDQGRLDDAEALLQNAISLYRAALRGDGPQVATTLSTLAGLLAQRGSKAAAEASFREAIAIERRFLPTPHPQTAETLNNLALFLLQSNRPSEAEPLFLEALDQTRRTLGESSSQTAVILNNLGYLAHNRRDYAQAREHYVAALAAVNAQQEPKAGDLSLALHNLGSLALDQGDLATADGHFRAALDAIRRSLGDDHLNAARVRLSLAEVALKRGDARGGEALARDALRGLERALGSDDVWVVAARKIVDRCVAAQKAPEPPRPSSEATPDLPGPTRRTVQ